MLFPSRTARSNKILRFLWTNLLRDTNEQENPEETHLCGSSTTVLKTIHMNACCAAENKSGRRRETNVITKESFHKRAQLERTK